MTVEKPEGIKLIVLGNFNRPSSSTYKKYLEMIHAVIVIRKMVETVK